MEWGNIKETDIHGRDHGGEFKREEIPALKDWWNGK